MLYFENELLPRFNLTNTVPAIDLKLLESDPVLLQSVVAVAHAHAASRSVDYDGKALSLQKIQSRNRALKVFREHLMGAHTDEVHGSLFIANVLLCILDGIIEPSAESSATHHHLVGGKAILKQWTGMKSVFQLKYELPVLMLSIFATMDLTHSVLIGDDPYFEASSWTDFGDCEAWWGKVRPSDDFLETMSIISQLATLGYKVRSTKELVEIGTLLTIQMSLEQQAARQLETKNVDTAAWTAFCSVYRFAASAYLYRALSGLDVGHPLVQQVVTSFIEVIGGTDLTEKLHHCILFPLLCVGSHCLVPEQRALVRKSLGTTSSYLSFEGLRSLESFLEERWTRLDKNPSETLQMTWWEYFSEIAHASCLF
jgi:hypothetical protein